jgi:hypothetical protein
MIAVTRGTTSWRCVNSLDELTSDEVLFEGVATDSLVWGDDIQNLREPDIVERLALARATKIAELKTACTTQIQGGFISNALGSGYTYESKLPQDQTNLMGAAMLGADLSFTCIDATGYKSKVPHTAAQLKQVFLTGALHIESATTKYDLLKKQVEVASLDDLPGISW